MPGITKERARALAEMDADIAEASFEHGESYSDRDREEYVHERAAGYESGKIAPPGAGVQPGLTSDTDMPGLNLVRNDDTVVCPDCWETNKPSDHEPDRAEDMIVGKTSLPCGSCGHAPQFVLRCQSCGHVGDRTFISGEDGRMRDGLGGERGVTPDSCACSVCDGRDLELVKAS